MATTNTAAANLPEPLFIQSWDDLDKDLVTSIKIEFFSSFAQEPYYTEWRRDQLRIEQWENLLRVSQTQAIDSEADKAQFEATKDLGFSHIVEANGIPLKPTDTILQVARVFEENTGLSTGLL